MTNISNFNRLNLKHLSLAAAIVVSAFGSISVPNSAFANGTHPSGGGAVCKGAGHCLVLQLDCKGTYTDATDSNGTVYGKCSQTAQVSPKNKLKLAR
ncbi:MULTISPECIES: hypothetical protein [unclassified Mesorhizobium]|uniref:hypothetical protein n=1 Tax=unclassified Mesorhizobium TaxID=325217 RepID=UPI000FE70891|nr:MULTISPECIES: hypothetical protein [unclassified Mesorhizobium]RWI14125.1 MAG: hypothetical protein EOQ92_29605 [Mesorhizobium sp.]RWK46996.1 MAG: hypothetical protein EOR47_23700 [Mesorhizobium sp.]RWK91828.1 MAG: hypothetical protein EOR53_27695 [Mesorhizobium sp.]TIP95056.1 MAG: hypothetical protein E5X60_22870 [Mesorhizobium sp.]TIQ19334.1 MAG: hypothetical protein E5X51_21320 [Mesorhizobium sp.]